jgi:hypothetical protein
MITEVPNILGFPQKTLEMVVLYGIGISVIGTILVLFWRYILFGAVGLFCFVVMANSGGITQSTKAPEAVIAPEVISEDQFEFLDDCQTTTDYNKEQCMEIWNSQPVKARKMYKAKKEDYLKNAKFSRP